MKLTGFHPGIYIVSILLILNPPFFMRDGIGRFK
jgi:hypothetical protein